MKPEVREKMKKKLDALDAHFDVLRGHYERRLKAARERLAYWQGKPSFSRHTYRPWVSDATTRAIRLENAAADIISLEKAIKELDRGNIV